MKQITLTIATALLLAGCYFNTERGSGKLETQKRTVDSFTGIHAESSVDVVVKQGPQDVEVEADDNLMQYVVTKVKGNKLVVGIKSGMGISNGHIKVTVTAPEINMLTASSSADIRAIDVIKSNGKIIIDANSSADIEAAIDAPEVDAEASSSASILLNGRTKNYKAHANSSGQIKSFELLSENTNASASSSGFTGVHASVSLSANASSSGNVEYIGGAQVISNISSSGSVSKKG